MSLNLYLNIYIIFIYENNLNIYIDYMAKPFVEVFKYEEMVEGKCYAQGNYTDAICNDPRRYFFKGQPTYVGKLLQNHREGVAHGTRVWSTFIKDGVKTDIDHNEDGKTAFAEVSCEKTEETKETKGGRRNTLRKRRKNRRTKYRR